MEKLPDTMYDIFDEKNDRVAEEALTEVIAALERDGVDPRTTAMALSRVLLVHCQAHGHKDETFAWAMSVLFDAGEFLEKHGVLAKNPWLRRFAVRTAKVFHAAWSRFAPPVPARLNDTSKVGLLISNAKGNA